MIFANCCITCFLQLEGVNEPVILQVFVGIDAERVRPHGFYQACRVTGRNTTACKEVDIGGTTVIEVPLDPSTNMTLAYVLCCLGEHAEQSCAQRRTLMGFIVKPFEVLTSWQRK